MATRNRREFVEQSLLSFTHQTWCGAEMIVVDDGSRPVADLCICRENVRYFRFDTPATIGEKLNAGISEARGEVIQKWDDDDYHHPDFLTVAVSALPEGAHNAVVLWDCFLVLLAGERGLRHSGCGWNTGATLCFHRELWHRRKFRNVPQSEDSRFLEDHRPEIIRICAPEHYIVVRHGANTWNRMEDGSSADEYFWNLPLFRRPIQELVHPDQIAFYRSLTAQLFPGKG